MDTPESRAITSQLRRTNIGIGLLAAFFVVLRFLARWRRRVKPGLDDYLMAVSLIFLAGAMVNIEITIENGLGINGNDLSFDQNTAISKCLLAYEFIFLVYVSVIKIAILLTYYRIFNHRRYKIATYIMIAVISSWCISFVFAGAFQCQPVSFNWDNTPGAGICLNFALIFVFNSISNILIDLVMLCMPIRQVWKLQMSTYQRVSLTILFLLGSFVVFTSAYRLYVLVNYNEDNSYATQATSLIWSHIESCATSISACLPILRPLVELFLYKTGLRSKAPSQSSQTTIGAHKAPSKPLRLPTQEEAAWPPVAEISSDEALLRPARAQLRTERSQRSFSSRSELDVR